MSDYLVEQVDEDAMTDFILAATCRRVVLSRSFDKDHSAGKVVDCIGTDSVFCDCCKVSNGQARHTRPQLPLEQLEEPRDELEATP
jgi:hypothetical protein